MHPAIRYIFCTTHTWELATRIALAVTKPLMTGSANCNIVMSLFVNININIHPGVRSVPCPAHMRAYADDSGHDVMTKIKNQFHWDNFSSTFQCALSDAKCQSSDQQLQDQS